MRPRKHSEADLESDDEASGGLESADDDDGGDAEDDDEEDDEDGDDEDGGDEERDDESDAAASSARARSGRSAWQRRVRRRARGAGGMGRPSTGPAPRPSTPPSATVNAAPSAAPAPESAEAELAPDISAWPGTAEAARMVGRHVSTIKLWRAQGRIRALQDGAGCWRHHPDDLAESVDTPDATDPGSVLASGMTAIVQQGASANDRLLTMTEIATSGLETATGVLSKELERAYAKIADLEQKLSEAKDRLAVTHELDLKHERYMRRLEQKHDIEVTGSAVSSARLEALLTVIGPIAASIAARLIGNIGEAERIEAAAVGASPNPAPTASTPSSPSTSAPAAAGASAAPPVSPPPAKDLSLVPIETRITDAMSRLCIAIRSLDGPAFRGLRAMMPPPVQGALDDIVEGRTDSAVGQALATLIKAAQGLSDLQFQTLRPIAPADIGRILAELRELIAVKEEPS